MSERGLTHLDPLGRARMVDVTPKDPSHRRAVARGRVHMQPETTALVARGSVGKGDVLNVMGRIHYTKWQDQQGNDRYGCEIIAGEVLFL